ncbi:MAG: PSD1 and planctomycete cytochrome C domain-containing protein [Planctomycetales bacterium]
MCALLAAAALVWMLLAGAVQAQDEGLEFFEKEIRPVLRRECWDCHHTGQASGSLALDSREGWKSGGDSGPAIVPGEPEKSLLLQAIRHKPGVVAMPDKSPQLSAETIAAFEKWIRIGAPDPRDTPEAVERDEGGAWDEIVRERMQWFCWQPLRRGAADGEAHRSIDDWIDQGIAAAGITPAGPADRRTLIRRLSYQLCGLPPAPADVDAFLKDPAPDAWERCVDRFLARPEMGIHWARHWLDVVRYSETHGSEDDALLPFSYRYRDYMIRAFQADLPFDQLIREHLAGDLIPPRWNRELGLNEALIGLAFLRFVEFNQTPVDVKREEIVVIDNQIEALGKVFQGMTISCARCHDHKFDPISDEDYYALYGIFRSTRTGMRILDPPDLFLRDQETLQQLHGEIRAALTPLWLAQIAQWPDELRQARQWCREHVRSDSSWKDLESTVATVPWTRTLAQVLCQHDPKTPGPFFRAPLKWLGKILTADDATWKTTVDEQTGELAAQFARAAVLPENAQRLFDLTEGDLTGWRIAGAGLPADAVRQAGAWSVEGGTPFLMTGVLERGFHTNRLSDRHGGSLRSPDFVLEAEEISVQVRGTGRSRARLVIENFQGDSLLFEGVNPTLDAPILRWVTMPIKPQWRGLRAHLELLTRDDKPYLGVVKDPSLLEQSDGRSSFGLAQVVQHPRGARPIDAPLCPQELLPLTNGPEAARGVDDWIARFCAATQQVVARFQAGTATDNDARWISVLMQGGLLTSNAAFDGTVSQPVEKYRQREDAIPIARRSPGVYEDHCAVDQPWLPRGDHRLGKTAIPRRYLAVLGSRAEEYAGPDAGRLRLAEEIASPDNPLTARVYVNRVWHWLFGRGLVATVDNFGRMGEPPTHPELLDQLAREFIADGWSTRRLIRRLLLTRAWQRASVPTAAAAEVDPGNRWWSHASVRRLEAEAIRDTLLSLSGKLRETDGGLGTRGFYRVVQEPNKQSPPGPLDGDSRRSIYLEVRRNFPNEFLLAFDFPRPAAPAGRRPLAIVPAQSLTLMNDPFVVQQTQLWADRVTATEPDAANRVSRLYRELLGREPTAAEQDQAAKFLQQAAQADNSNRGWRLLAHALVNLKEAIYLP